MKRWIFFFIFILSVTTPLFLYLHWSLEASSGLSLLSSLFCLVLLFPVLRRWSLLAHFTFLAMGLLSFILVFTLLRDVIWITGFKLHSLWIISASVIAMITGTLVALKGPQLKRLKLPIQDLPKELEGLRIVQISDLHIGPTIGRSYVEKMVKKVNELEADIVALTGDIGDGPVERHRQDIAPLSKIQSKLGTFYVPGNHEYYWNANEWMNVMNNLKAIVLVNRGKIIHHQGQSILIGGIPDPMASPGPDLQMTHDASPEAPFKILLSHRPGFAEEASALGFHLQLSGHTHGGQFFPWTVAVRFAHKYFLGHYQVGQMWLNVNPGTGSWGPFLRLGTTSEITLIEIYRSGSSLEKL